MPVRLPLRKQRSRPASRRPDFFPRRAPRASGPAALARAVRTRLLCGGLLCGGLLCVGGSTAAAVEPDRRTLDRLHSGLLRDDLRVLGAASCATASCHGGPQPGVADPAAARGNEYPLWIERDPHAQSWRTICSDESVAILNRLGILEQGAIVDVAQFNNCLACHNSAPVASATGGEQGVLGTTAANEGVGCTACHGPAEHWIGTHFQWDWHPARASAAGFVPLDDLLARAKTCAACHVGDRDRDMNHDIIAAGHPVLRFDMATYHAWLPKHWRDAEAADPARYTSRLWLAGAIATADASLALLEARSQNALTVSTWPEFSAYDCASCHQDLGLDSRLQPPGGSEPPRPAKYSRWERGGLEQLLEYRRARGEWTSADQALAASLVEVEQRMESSPRPDRLQIAAAAAEARRHLASWADQTTTATAEPAGVARGPFDAAALSELVRLASQDEAIFQTWESSAQYYLWLAAARGGWPAGSARHIDPLAARLRHALAFPSDRDSPTRWPPALERPPATREELRQWAQQIGRSLQAPTDRDELPESRRPLPPGL